MSSPAVPSSSATSYLGGNLNANRERALLSLRCVGLAVSPKASFGVSMLSNLYVRATNSSVKNERRYLKLYQSEPFDPNGRPPTQYNYTHVYTSEIFEDTPNCCASLLASIYPYSQLTQPSQTPHTPQSARSLDSKMRLSVYYSSNLTGNKDVLLASATFTERELSRGMHIAGELATEFMSEHLSQKAMCHVEIVPRMGRALDEACVITAKERETNPLSQDYVFYNEEDPLYPALDAREETWEPAHTATVPLLFLEEVQHTLQRSIAAWEHRQELERMRQSRFATVYEAHSRGWHALDVEVKGARFLSRNSQTNTITRSITRIPSQRESTSSVASLSTAQQTQTANTNNAPLPYYMLSFPLTADHCEDYAGLRSHTSLSTEAQAQAQGASTQAARSVRKIDDRAPSSFVSISVHDKTHTFSTPLGRTSTEYSTAFPMYGSALNNAALKKSVSTAVPANDTVHTVQCDREFLFFSCESTNRLFVPRRWRTHNNTHSAPTSLSHNTAHSNFRDRERESELLDDDELHEDSPFVSVNTVTGKSVVFRKFIPRCEDVCVSCELTLETASGQQKVLGTCALPLSEGLRTQRWLPVNISAREDMGGYECVELLVSVCVESPPPSLTVSEAQRAPDSMPEVLRTQRDVHGQLTHSLPHTLAQTERALPDYRAVLCDCYEWLWQLGFNGSDPLEVETNNIAELPNRSPSVPTSVQNTANSTPTRVIRKQPNELDSDDEGEEEESCERAFYDEHSFSARASIFDKDENPAMLMDLSALTLTEKVSQRAHTTHTPTQTTPTQSRPVSQKSVSVCGSVSGSVSACARRVDCEYTLSFLSRHVSQLRTLSAEVAQWIAFLSQHGHTHSHTTRRLSQRQSLTHTHRQSLSLPPPPSPSHTHHTQCPQSHTQDTRTHTLTFRASPLKKDVCAQPLPINMHYQLLCVRAHVEPQPAVGVAAQRKGSRKTATAMSSPLSTSEEVLHSVTCGSLCAHLLGYKQGGLFHQEDQLVQMKNTLSHKKRAFQKRVDSAPIGSVLSPSLSAAGELLGEIHDRIAGFESLCVQVGRRRISIISQALSVAVNAFLLKLNLLLAAQIEEKLAARWLSEGLLIVFEGLLSVSGNERSMLEDTISAVEALRLYQVRLRCERTHADSETPSHIDTHPETHAQTNAPLRFSMRGREICVSLTREMVQRLPSVYRESIERDCATLKFIPVLFTQGIDIQQTMVTTFGGDASRPMTSLDLQHHVNLKGLRDVNEYSYKYQPVSVAQRDMDRGRESSDPGSSMKPRPTSSKTPPLEAQSPSPTRDIHPFVCALHESITHASLAMKNVDLLLEVERVALFLGGVRVTFCKSGKDRTGMAVTLEQSRQLGERFGCGVSGERCLRDAQRMRLYGTRLALCEKNIGRPVYSINALQAKFLPVLFRPPPAVCEDILKKDNS